MNKLIAAAIAASFAFATASHAQYGEQKKEQVHKGTPEAGTVQKKDQKQDKKKDGSGGAKKADAATK